MRVLIGVLDNHKLSFKTLTERSNLASQILFYFSDILHFYARFSIVYAINASLCKPFDGFGWKVGS
jgi:hypothetical protein